MTKAGTGDRLRDARVCGVNFPTAAWRELAHLLEGRCRHVLCGYAQTFRQLQRTFDDFSPDLVLLDLRSSGKRGLELIKRTQAWGKTKILAVSEASTPDKANRTLQAGADGYVLGSDGSIIIVQAMEDVLAGRVFVSEDVLASGSTASWSRRKRQLSSTGPTPTCPVARQPNRVYKRRLAARSRQPLS
jgi:DNA-binding NarL/FixJ family response regulator